MNRRWQWCLALCTLIAFALLSLGGMALADENEQYSVECDNWIVLGSSLTVRVMPRTGATKYSVSLVEGSTRIQLYEKTVSSAGPVTIPASKIPAAGFYDIMVSAMNSSGNYIDGTWKTFVVFEHGLSGSDVVFYVSTETVGVDDPFMCYVYAPGAESVGIVGFDRYSNEMADGDFKAICTQLSEAGEQEFRPIAVYPDGSTYLGDARTVTVTAPYSLGAFNPSIPSSVNKGKDLVFTITPAANAASLLNNHHVDTYYEITVCDAESGDFVYEKIYDQAGEGATALGSSRKLTVAASKLTSGHIYVVRLFVYCYGAESIEIERYVYVKGTVSADLELSINGSTGTVNAQTGDIVTVRAKLKDSGRHGQLRLGYDEHPFYYAGEENWPSGGVFTFTVRLDDEGVFPAFVQTCNDSWTPSTVTSNVITLNVTATGEAATPAYQMPASVARGDFLKIDITNPSPDSRYSGYVTGGTAEFWQWIEEEYYIDGSLYVDTSRMPEGLYNVTVTNREPGKRPAEKSSWFQVVAPEGGSDAFRFHLMADRVLLDDALLFGYYAPDADHITVFTRSMTDVTEVETCESFGHNYNNSSAIYFYDSGRYEVYARAYPNDYDDEDYGESEHFTVTVTSLGITPCAVECPGLVQSGQDVVFALEGLENADQYWEFTIWEYDDGYSDPIVHLTSNNTAPISSYTLSGSQLQEGSTYFVQVEARARGFEYGYSDASFYVFDQIDDNISVTVDGGSYAQCLINENVTVRIEAPGATSLEWLAGAGWNEAYGFDPDTGVYVTGLSFDSPGNYTILARACYDGSGEMDAVSASAVVKVISYGQVGELSAEVLTPSVPRDGMLRIRMNEADNATVFEIELGYVEDEIMYGEDRITIENVEAPCEFSIPVAVLEPGDDYTVCIEASAPGYQGKEIRGGILTFSVTEPASEASFQVSKQALFVGEPLFFSAYSSAYEELFIMLGDEEIAWYDEDHYVYGDYTFDEPGTYTLSAWAWVDGEDPVRIGEDITVTVSDKPPLRAPTLSGPSVVLSSELPSAFTIGSVPHASLYVVVIEQNGEWCGTLTTETAGTLDLGLFTLEPGKVYTIRAVATDPGYSNSESTERSFALVEEGKVLTLPKGVTVIEAHAFEGISAQVVVLPAGIRSVEANAFEGCQDLVAVIVPAGAQGIDPQAFAGCADDIVIVEEP